MGLGLALGLGLAAAYSRGEHFHSLPRPNGLPRPYESGRVWVKAYPDPLTLIHSLAHFLYPDCNPNSNFVNLSNYDHTRTLTLSLALTLTQTGGEHLYSRGQPV